MSNAKTSHIKYQDYLFSAVFTTFKVFCSMVTILILFLTAFGSKHNALNGTSEKPKTMLNYKLCHKYAIKIA
jgi:hypothetical protein